MLTVKDLDEIIRDISVLVKVKEDKLNFMARLIDIDTEEELHALRVELVEYHQKNWWREE